MAKDYAQAHEWYQKAVVGAGNANAMYGLAELYYWGGHGMAQDRDQAREWYQKAANAGNAEAMYDLGQMYEKGTDMDRDYAQARYWYQKAADAKEALVREAAKEALARLPSK